MLEAKTNKYIYIYIYILGPPDPAQNRRFPKENGTRDARGRGEGANNKIKSRFNSAVHWRGGEMRIREFEAMDITKPY